jgi:streptomycin 3"-adenylyltransferase
MIYGHEDCPKAARLQINLIIDLCKKHITNNLTGVYLHGSLAMGCFNPERSDLDIIVVIKEKISPDTKIQIVKELMDISLKSSQIEVSFLIEGKLAAEEEAFNYDLHYSEYWRKRYEKLITRPIAQIWRDESLRDPDLAAHIRIINDRGITLFGKDKDSVFPRVSDEDYLKAILFDFDDAFEGYVKNPEYHILNACRVLNFLVTGHPTSKKEAGEWGVEVLPYKFKPLIKIALNVYIGKVSGAVFESNAVKKYLSYVNKKITERIG